MQGMHGLDRDPPANTDAEDGLIAALLLDPASLTELPDNLQPDDFFRADNGDRFAAIRAIAQRGQEPNVIAVAEELARTARPHGPPPAEVVAGLICLCERHPASWHAGFYADLILQKSATRRLIHSAQAIIADAYSHNYDAATLFDRAERGIFAVTQSRQTRSIRTLGQAMDEVIGRIESPRALTGTVTSGLTALDNLLGYFSGGQVVTVAARPSVGKTALGFTIAAHIAERHGPVKFDSLEMRAEELGTRFLSAKADLNNRFIAEPRRLEPADRAALAAARREHADLPLFIDDSPVATVSSISSAARRMKARTGLAALFVDYLGLVTSEADARASLDEKIGHTTRGLKSLAKELDVPIFLLAQFNRESEAGRGVVKAGERRDHVPKMSQLRGSGNIEQDSDVVIILHRPDFYDKADRPREADLIVDKNRAGMRGTVRTLYHDSRTTFMDHTVHNLARLTGVPAASHGYDESSAY